MHVRMTAIQRHPYRQGNCSLSDSGGVNTSGILAVTVTGCFASSILIVAVAGEKTFAIITAITIHTFSHIMT